MELAASLQTAGGSLAHDGYLLLLSAIMLAAGVLGGLANYFISDRGAGFSAKALLRHVVLGTVAAFTVPLFLNMISSDLLALARSRPIDLFVFGGFCLLFVLLTRRLQEGARPQSGPGPERAREG